MMDFFLHLHPVFHVRQTGVTFGTAHTLLWAGPLRSAATGGRPERHLRAIYRRIYLPENDECRLAEN